MAETILDRAHAAMAAAPEDDAARLRFYERLADAELFLLLQAEPVDDAVAPQLFALEEGPFAVAFDSEERLAAFAEAVVPYVALPGRVVARELAGQGVGLGLNLGVAPSEFLMPAEALAWLAGTLAHVPEHTEARPISVAAPAGLPEAVVAALDAKLAGLAGLAWAAHLVAVGYEGGRRGHLLAFEGARAGAETALAKAVSEALVFSGIEAGEIDVAFLTADDALTSRILRVALRFDLPEPQVETAQVLAPSAPGMDPARPPKLR
ncbi:SseB family protein [Defluviimonas salinarum]|uniref:SseB family protein n=1 Tax=Defluviimonas salinarum TaxID=2992147 RepID=A0ABT3J601_9RHOB|nr:SseB family protein [Defluviimonas salinarum]MCW3783122.1 SseB family protein [Defluviimonas salinarum]